MTKAIAALLFAVFFCGIAHGQDMMLSKALRECVWSGSPAEISPPPPPQDAGLYYMFCIGDKAAALFSEMRGRTNEKKYDGGLTVRSAGRGLQCTLQSSGSVSCLIAIDVGKSLIDAMK